MSPHHVPEHPEHPDILVADPPIRLTLAGRFGLPVGESIPRRAAEIAFWLGLAPLGTRVLRRAGTRLPAAVPLAVNAERCWASGVSRALGLRIEWAGLDWIDPAEPYVVVALHEGFADVLALLGLPLRMRFVVRDELAGWPLLGPYLRDTGQVIVRPESGASSYRGLLRRARELTGNGESLVIFPQGTILGIESRFRPGAFAIARALDRPILPIAVTGSHRVWEHPYSSRLRFGQRVSLRVLPPVAPERLRRDGVDAIMDEIQGALKAAALDGRMAPPRRFVPERDGYWDGYAYEIDPAFPHLAEDIRRHREAVRHAAAGHSAATPSS